jgi:hypothetical protein
MKENWATTNHPSYFLNEFHIEQLPDPPSHSLDEEENRVAT